MEKLNIITRGGIADSITHNGFHHVEAHPPIAKRVMRLLLRKARAFWRGIDRMAMCVAERSGFGSSLYYVLFDRSFDREHRSVLAGRLAFDRSRKSPAETASLLRRNIHRIEKGLVMKPRRGIFALDYITETMRFYAAAVQQKEDQHLVSSEELRWAYDVLSDYFDVSEAHPKLNALRSSFERLPVPQASPKRERRAVPYARDLKIAPSVSYEDLLVLSWRRRSVRWFQQRVVPRELIEKAIAVAALSPSACNRQPFFFQVFDDPTLLRQVASLPGGTVGFHENFPMIIVVVGELRNYYGERDRHLIYIDGALASMSFIYAAETLGLSTCCINWPDIEEFEERATELLKLEADQRPIMFIAVGFPDPEGMVPYSQKKANQQVCKFNFE